MPDNDDSDQQENHRRETAKCAIARLPEAEQEAALQIERAQIDAYENTRVSSTPQSSENALEGKFPCQKLGCTASFQTLYLLK